MTLKFPKYCNSKFGVSQVYLVTGGYTGVPYGFLDSTELLRDGEGQWTYSGQLPSYRFALRGATVNNKVIVTGTHLPSMCMYEKSFIFTIT